MPSPALSPEQAAWVEGILQEKGLRPPPAKPARRSPRRRSGR